MQNKFCFARSFVCVSKLMFSGGANISPQDPSLRYATFEDDKRGLLQCVNKGFFSTLLNPALVILE
ncbi:MAG: hypothetical protein IJ002_01515, partial [Clostridia bacterium]|nr:hypothetical protein [Clostridia bacterium]